MLKDGDEVLFGMDSRGKVQVRIKYICATVGPGVLGQVLVRMTKTKFWGRLVSQSGVKP